MDKIVSQYTRSPEQDEFLAEQQELTETTPPLSLKFNLPPLDNVSYPLFPGSGWPVRTRILTDMASQLVSSVL